MIMRGLKLLNREERGAAARWAADTTWTKQERYLKDLDYMDCVADAV